ncbi:MAG: hypothetical protein ACOVS5_18030 [Oligoflexus sp.]
MSKIFSCRFVAYHPIQSDYLDRIDLVIRQKLLLQPTIPMQACRLYEIPASQLFGGLLQ